MNHGFKVGELAKSAGLTVRTLHHWDAIGLLSPSSRTSSGHRLYGDADVRRLYQVVALRDLGLPLEQIAAILDGEPDSLGDILAGHLARIEARITGLRSLHGSVAALLARVGTGAPPTTPDLLELVDEVSKMSETFQSYFSQEQIAALEQRRDRLGADYFDNVRAEWGALIPRVQSEMDAGTEPADPKARALAKRWMELLSAFDDGDSGLREANFRMHAENADEIARAGGPSPEMIDYIQRANQA